MVDFSLPMLCGHLVEMQLFLLAVDTVQVPNGWPAHEGLNEQKEETHKLREEIQFQQHNSEKDNFTEEQT